MENEFIPYKQALALKELGFNEPCFATYRTNAVGSKKPFEYDIDYHTKVEMSSNVIPVNSEYTEESKWISAPLYQQAFRWFREKYGKESYVRKLHTYYYHINDTEAFVGDFSTYEEAELECLKKLIEIIKNGN